MTNIAAYTPPGGAFPPYVSVNEVPDGIRISVRSRATAPNGYPEAGSYAEITVCREVARALFGEAMENLS